jgi:hypothetical protein
MDDIPTKEELQAYSTELMKLRNGVATATLAWSEIENAMTELLTAILNRDDMHLPAAMYFSLSGIEARFRLVSAALVELLHPLKKAQEKLPVADQSADQVLKLWRPLANRLRRLKDTRNQVAHGQIMSIGGWADDDKLGTPRLTSPMWDVMRRLGDLRASRKPPPGLRSNDIFVHSAAVTKAAEHIRDLNECVRLIHAANKPALREKLAQLEREHPHQDGPNSLTPPKPGSRHRASTQTGRKLSAKQRRLAALGRRKREKKT